MPSGAEPQRRPRGKAQAVFFRAFEGAKGDTGSLQASWRTIQITIYAKSGEHKRSEAAAKFVLKGEGRATEERTVRTDSFDVL